MQMIYKVYEFSVYQQITDKRLFDINQTMKGRRVVNGRRVDAPCAPFLQQQKSEEK